MAAKLVKQCKSCPWRVGVDPDRDIPGGYSVEKHLALRSTIADGTASMHETVRAMACHGSPVGSETPCAGWLHNQIGVGNNIGLRLLTMTERMPIPVVDGDQHETFEATLPRARSRR